MSRFLTTLFPCFLLLGACDGPTPAPPPEDPAVAASAPAVIAKAPPAALIPATTGRGLLQADPATLPNCESAVVNVRWDATRLHPDLTAVEVHVIAPGETAGKLFAAGGAADAAASGPWANPGLVFQARDTAGNELDRITLGGPDCR